jgi:gentisate 1,2-dioxygenase
MNTVNARWARQVVSWEYSAAASPDLAGVPVQPFPASLHREGPTRVIALDLSKVLGTTYPATAPNLLANYIRVAAGERIDVAAEATSEVFYVMRGAGRTETADGVLEWREGDAFTLPHNGGVTHQADADAALYWVHDGPLLQYLGATPTAPRFRPAFYDRDAMDREIERIREAGIREGRNRLGIILGNTDRMETKTATHTMWSLLNLLPAGAVQPPHRHNSVALDLSIRAGGDAYTLIARRVDEAGRLIDPVRADWETQSVFVTPPGWWHSHHNESDRDAYVFPVQDAGLHTYMRTLDIRFVTPDGIRP